MKIYFTVTDTTSANAGLSCDSIELKFNGEWLHLEKCAALLHGDPVFAAISSTAYGVWLNMHKKIQGVRYTTQAAVLTTAEPNVLSDGHAEAFGQVLQTSITEFQAGKSYLIPFTAGAVTDIIPQQMIFGMENTVDLVFVASHYRYDCSETHQTRNGTTFTGYVFEPNILGIATNAAASERKDAKADAAFVQRNLN